ncbi:hypothetical protein K450DRAFT_244894 [Umbelopsis ramanniana AG]|uniref:Uncharacterized protein n=1 Tax=Umbelopsis ramanniana AG TaxID=1314678 RepID=A0AAD5E8V9_UMBRA|nr:uncharacterized protein K450DRAFT_244894 [Umbelopsis ramanniana AG]KAI8578869.1 hypothetical protein K450DRAFT_244894 [Umbelopsis ramanniana AG]
MMTTVAVNFSCRLFRFNECSISTEVAFLKNGRLFFVFCLAENKKFMYKFALCATNKKKKRKEAD